MGPEMRISDAAVAAGLTPRALRYYEQRGLLTVRRTPAGQRTYTAEDVRQLRAVRELLRAGLTIDDVRTLVTALETSLAALPPDRRPAPGTPCTLPGTVVRRRLADLDERIERLTELRDGLARSVGAPLRALAHGLAPGDAHGWATEDVA